MNEENSFIPCHPEPLLIVISGPSGVGKDTIIDLMKNSDHPLHFVVTATTRPPRQEEVHGVDYFFISKDEFARMIEQDELLEYAVVYKDFKGIPKQQVREALASGKDVIMRVDVQGASTIRNLCPDATLIFLTTETEEELVTRLKNRGSETPDEVALRIATARQELKRVDLFDYIVVNRKDHISEAVETIQAIICAEHHKVHHRKVSL